MFEYFKARLSRKDSERIIVDIAGVGLMLYLSKRDMERLPPVGSEIIIFTSFIVREFCQTFYGFLEQQERDIFEKLITISGVGPKLALGLLGAFTLEELGTIMLTQDAKTLSTAPGVGKKTAARLLVELKDVVFPVTATMAITPISDVEDALEALLQLGYTRQQAQVAVKKVIDANGPKDLSSLVAAALQQV